MSHKNRRARNRAETIAEIPLDWVLRWDASVKDGITYNTDEATNDVDGWTPQEGPEGLGTFSMDALSIAAGTQFPNRLRDVDGLLHMRFYGAGEYCLRQSNILSANAALHARFDDATNVTVFVVGKYNDMAGAIAGNHYVCGATPNEWTTPFINQGPKIQSRVNGAFRASTNDFDDRRFMQSFRNVHNGTDDNDVETWVGKTSIYSAATIADSEVSGSNTFAFGSHGGGSSDVWYADCNVYECLWYGRSLSDAEIDAVNDYLSAKWQTTNTDKPAGEEVISADFPMDYYERWDSTTSKDMTFTTSEAVGDLNQWIGEKGNVTLTDQSTGTRPIWDPGQVVFAGTGNRGLGAPGAMAAFQDASFSMFCAGKMDGDIAACSMVQGPEYFIRYEYDTGSGGQYNFFFNDGVSNDNFPANLALSDKIACGYSLTRTGTDIFDIDQYWGKTQTLHTSLGTLNNAHQGLFVGMANTSGVTTLLGEMYEVILYDRAVTQREANDIIDYLSHKWQTANADETPASPTITTGRTWVSDYIDPQGDALANYTPVNHRVELLNNLGGPREWEDIPPDYVARWHAEETDRMTFSGSDITAWDDRFGNSASVGTMTNPTPTTLNGVTVVDFEVDDGMDFINHDWNDAGTNPSIFVAYQLPATLQDDGVFYAFDNENTTANATYCGTTTTGLIYNNIPTVFSSFTNWESRGMHMSWIATSNTVWKRFICSESQTNGTRTTSSAGAADMKFGSFGNTTQKGKVGLCEILIYNRELSDAEIERVHSYMAAKWEVSYDDTTTRSPGRILGSGPSDKFPLQLPNLKAWWRSDHTGSMTFETGDAIAGGTVSAWTDITGDVVADTAKSGDSDVTFHPSGQVRGGFPSVEGGTAGTPRSLEGAGTLSNADTGQQKLQWSVGTFGDATINTTWGGPQQNVMFGCTLANFSTDQIVKPATSYVGGTTAATGITYTVANAGPPADNGDIHIFVWRVEDTGTEAIVDSWYAGLKLPTRVSTIADGTVMTAGIGALSTSNFDAHGAQMLEIGSCFSTTSTIQTYTDQDVEDLIKYLCQRYHVDYISESTPLTVGCWGRQTASLSQTDCALWFRSADIVDGGNKLPLAPWCADLHTTPANFDAISAEASTNPPEVVSGIEGRLGLSYDATNNEALVMDNTYSMAETTDFPATTDGATWWTILRGVDLGNSDNLFCVSYGTIGGPRKFSSFDLWQNFAGNVSHGSLGQYTRTSFGGGSYIFTASTDDATNPDTRAWSDGDFGQAEGGAYESFGAIRAGIGNGSAGTADNDCIILETGCYKSPLERDPYADDGTKWTTSIDALRQYAEYWYPTGTYNDT
jgi:hypothetical protein